MPVKSFLAPLHPRHEDGTQQQLQHAEEHSSPLLDDVVKFVVGFVVLQALHSIPLTLPIGLAQLPNKHLEGEQEP